MENASTFKNVFESSQGAETGAKASEGSRLPKGSEVGDEVWAFIVGVPRVFWV